MLAKAISPQLSLSEQISVSDVKTIAELGFKSIFKAAVAAFEPARNVIVLDGCRVVKYERLKEYVPALEKYVERYQASLNFFHNLVAMDGDAGKAWFDVKKPDEAPVRIDTEFDIIHVCPPQSAPDFIKLSPLAEAAGWIDVEQTTLRHKSFDNIWALGDVTNAPNAKTAAAARKQAPVVAANVVADIQGKSAIASYDGYGSCPLTVERGKIVLAEFGYGGKLLPSFPTWLIDGTRPSRAAWFLKEKLLPPIYWNAMLRGHEWMAEPRNVTAKTE